MEQENSGWVQATVDELRVELAAEKAKSERYFNMVAHLESQLARIEAKVNGLRPFAQICECGGVEPSCARALDDRFTWGQIYVIDEILLELHKAASQYE